MPLIDIINLGCSKNLVDAEKLSTQLRSNGVTVSINPDKLEGEIVIVNTCGFIQEAKEESIDAILKAAGYTSYPEMERKLIVMGCLSERYREQLLEQIPEIDRIYGVSEISGIIRDLGFTFNQDKVQARNQSTPSHYAFLKISEGCNRNCSFCAIPLIRGKHVSLPIEVLVEEAQFLAEQGTRELILIAQDLSYYGIDLYKKPSLVDLLQKLEKIDGIEWIRIHYTYPTGFPEELLDLMASSSKICKYLDMPFQHITDRMLKIMRRGINRKKTQSLLDTIKESVPEIALRTTLLVGHPGETQEDFEELCRWVTASRFDRLGVFTYSHEENTHAGDHMIDDVPEVIKQERAARIMELQQEISLQINQSKVGNIYKVLIDRIEGDYYIGRTQHDSPDIDNEVLIATDNGDIDLGTFIRVIITHVEEFDLYGQKI